MNYEEGNSRIDIVFQSMRGIVVIGDNDLVITNLNAPGVVCFGWTADEIRGKSINCIIPNHPSELPEVTSTFLARHKTGHEFPIIVQGMRDAQATLVAWNVTLVVLPPVFDFSFGPSFQNSISRKLSLDDINCSGRRVFVRVDFNVPLDKEGNVIDDNRIRQTIPTIRKIISDGGRVILGSHLKRPKDDKDKSLSLIHVIPEIEKLLGQTVLFAPNALQAHDQVNELKLGEVLLLENLRFYKGESSNNFGVRMAMARVLALYCDLYVCDAFGTAHRDAASITGIPRVMGAGVAGLLMEKEVKILSRIMRNPRQPVVAIVGGSKVSDKIGFLDKLFNYCEAVIVGGAMAFTFLEAQGHSMGKSKVERVTKAKGKEIDLHVIARRLIKKAQHNGVNVVLPFDFCCHKNFENTDDFLTTKDQNVPKGYMALDIGPKTIVAIERVIAEARTVIWNGPLGVFEFPAFAKGSIATASAIAKNRCCLSVVGGGETAACAQKFRKSITHISTGGGATLELLEGKALPGLVSLTSAAPTKL